jgi:hypothetical protein
MGRDTHVGAWQTDRARELALPRQQQKMDPEAYLDALARFAREAGEPVRVPGGGWLLPDGHLVPAARA